jgi:hypothetical protein
MNERIKQLAEQVGAVRNVLAMGRHDGVLFTEFELEKFAELIVRECFDKMESEDSFYGQWMGRVIKEHFGVEE